MLDIGHTELTAPRHAIRGKQCTRIGGRMQASGGPRNSAPGTLTKLFFDAVEKFKRPDALQFKVDGKYEPISHLDLADRVRRVALGLQGLGIRAGDRVAILSENRPEWAIADYACLASALTDVP